MAPKPANVPMNKELKDQDINRKLQLYGIYTAFSKGKVPSNKQIDVALNSLLATKALSSPSSKLSSEGRDLVRDFRDVILDAKQLILVKNQGNLIQEFIWEAEHLQAPQSTQKPGVPVEKDAAKQHGQQVLEGLKTLGTLLITNGQFRKLLKDAGILLRDMAGDAASKAANVVRPSEDQLSQIDQAAPENTWHEKPDFSKESLKSQAKAHQERFKGSGRENGTDATGTKEDGNGNKIKEKTKEFLEEKMPKERRDQTIWRLKRMIVEIQGHNDYQQAIETLLSLAETYVGHGRDMSKGGVGAAKNAREESGLKSAEQKLKTIIERFANSTSSEDLFGAINQLYRDADKDPRLRGWFTSVNTYIRKCLREQGYVLEEAADKEWRRLYDEGRFLLRERYRGHANRVVDEIKFLGDQFDQDPFNKAFGHSMQRLFNNLGHDSQGNAVFKKHLVKDVANIILPATFEKIRYVPLPRIEVSDPMIDVVVENLVIESSNLLPNVVEFGSDNYWRWGRQKISNKRDNKVLIAASGIQTDWRDVSYYIKKKSGFPSIKDKGVMDVLMGGEGFSFRISGSNSFGEGQRQFIKPEHVSVTVNDLDIKLKKSKHKALFYLFKPMLFSAVKPAVQKVLEKQIRESFTKGDAFARKIYDEAHRSQKAARQDPEEEKRTIYSYYVDAFRRNMDEKKKKKQEEEAKKPKRDTKINLAITEHDSLFKDIKLPGGVSNKATEYKNLALQGERWESPVFSIGNASQSTDIRKLDPITRKSHSVSSPTNGTTGATGTTGTTGTNGVGSSQGRVVGGGGGGLAEDASVAQAYANGAKKTSDLANGPSTVPGTMQPI